MRVHVDETREERAARAVDLGTAGRAHAGGGDLDDPAVAHDDVTRAVHERGAGRVEHAHVPNDERAAAAGGAGDRRGVLCAADGGEGGQDEGEPRGHRGRHAARVARNAMAAQC